jgi:hypothetical protein
MDFIKTKYIDSLAGLEAQLLGIVVRKERPELEEQKGLLVRNIANGKKKIQQLEDEILRSTFLFNFYAFWSRA